MKRVSPGYYNEHRLVPCAKAQSGLVIVDVELVYIPEDKVWYWDASIDELHKYNLGGQDWYRTKREASAALDEAIMNGLAN